MDMHHMQGLDFVA